ncbi:MAG TPA: hypothetical protein DDW52_16435 [Planctomycetaceae bacterium]|nr:hypothetical protein [Planctomycetaceae bacterium]
MGKLSEVDARGLRAFGVRTHSRSLMQFLIRGKTGRIGMSSRLTSTVTSQSRGAWMARRTRFFSSSVWRVFAIVLPALFANAGHSAEPLDRRPSEQATPGETVYVRIARGQLRSGPSEDYYPTGKIAPGAKLEAFHETPDGWLAVRPTEDSFSWVPAKQAYMLPGGREIEITVSNAVSWIGSAIESPKQFRWQARLHKGEQLRLLGEATIKDADGKPMLWYRVAPPAGEFRWIQADAISRKPVVVVHSDDVVRPASHNSEAATSRPAVTTAQHTSVVETLPMQQGTSPAQTGDGESVTGELVEPSGQPATSQINEPFENEYYGPGDVFYEGEIVDGQIVGPFADGEIFEGEVIDGQIVEGPIYHGDVIAPTPAGPAGHFAGWHALEFTDQGMFMPWIAKLFNRQPQHDPLAHDPFSLEPIPPRATSGPPPVPNQAVHEVVHPHPYAAGSHLHSVPGGYAARNRPWRDPRTLRQQRSGAILPPPGERNLFNSPLEEAPRVAPEPTNGSGETQGGEAGTDEAYFNPRRGGPLAAATGRIDAVRSALRDTLRKYQSTGELNSESAPGEKPNSGGGLLQRLRGQSPYGDATSPSNANDPSDVNWYGVSGDSASYLDRSRSSGASHLASHRHSRATLPTTEELLIELSEQVSRPIEQWDLQPLVARVQLVIDDGATAIQRGEARLLLERVAEFERLQRQSGLQPRLSTAKLDRSSGANLGRPGATSASLASATRVVGSSGSSVPTARSAELQAKYDATGWLVHVHGSAAGKPNYALTDSAGQILAYVTPIPGMNFDAYLNKPVGVNGKRGFLPHLQASHIQGERIHEIR